MEIPFNASRGSGDATVKGKAKQLPETRTSNGVRILCDPIFSNRAGPTAFTGPARIVGPPCRIEDLPGVDIVFISHNQCVTATAI